MMSNGVAAGPRASSSLTSDLTTTRASRRCCFFAGSPRFHEPLARGADDLDRVALPHGVWVVVRHTPIVGHHLELVPTVVTAVDQRFENRPDVDNPVPR